MVTEWKLQLNLVVCMSGSHWNGTKRGGTTKNWKYFQKSTETCLYLCGQKCAERSPWSVTKVGIMQGPSSHVWMCGLDCKGGWALKKWCFWTVGLEKTLERPLDSKEIKSVNPKGNQPWIFIGRTDTEPEAPMLWPPDAKSRVIGKDPDAGKDWRQEETGMTEVEMVRWHHWLNGHEFEQTPGDREGQGRLLYRSL